ncbi:histidine kinase [Bacillus chungangensis]|uniref:histidine kinase n=1 Tax=Bacillus chungangensis TaxID=587633 RepID=A0ABT9WU12_9BACI|nr:histidine kinase [Bacillus chungangensis]MDQ0176785.1 CheY-like chemotaxis protein [Bacillus chungangensis]
MEKIKDEMLSSLFRELFSSIQDIMNRTQSTMNEQNRKCNGKQLENDELMIYVGLRFMQMLHEIEEVRKTKDTAFFHYRYLNLQTIVSVLLETMKYQEDVRSCKFINHVPSHLPKVYADEQQLTQLLSEIFFIAVKLSTTNQLVVGASVEEEMMLVRICDAKTSLASEAFHSSLAGNLIEVEESMYICKKLVETLGGEIAIQSPGNRNWSVYFTIPIKKKTLPKSESIAHPKILSNHLVLPTAKSILVVMDDPISKDAILSSLQPEYQLTIMSEGEEVLRALKKKSPWDLAIIDVMLPTMSGYELCCRLREQFSMIELPILMTTAQVQATDIQAGYEAGMNDYISKPIKEVELTARMQTLLRMKAAELERIRLQSSVMHAQIKPHFLYNTLNTIAALGEVDSDKTHDLLMEFGNYLRTSFDKKNQKQVVPFEQELALVKSYLYIEKARFADRLRVHMNIPSNLNFMLPPLTLQPLVENAVHHGIMKRIEGGDIWISVKEEKEFIHITIADNGVGFTNESVEAILKHQMGSGIGLHTTDQRLRLFYGTGLSIKTTKNIGTEITFKIPKDNID